MNNKQIGTDFEQDMVDYLAGLGYWVHFIVPDSRGAQPFDIIAVKDGIAYAIDCKTCVSDTFNITRMEENQKTSFELWMKCHNTMPIVAVKHRDKVYAISYDKLKKERSIKIENENCIQDRF